MNWRKQWGWICLATCLAAVLSLLLVFRPSWDEILRVLNLILDFELPGGKYGRRSSVREYLVGSFVLLLVIGIRNFVRLICKGIRRRWKEGGWK